MNLRKQIIVLVIVGFSVCFGQRPKESILDKKTYIHDSIVYNLPKVERLCDGIDLEKRYVNIGNCKLYYEVEGEGIPLVLINGGPGGTHHYFHPYFSSAKKFAQIIYYDQRGCGLSDFNPDEGYCFEQAADDLEKLRLKLGINNWVVMGYSYGGGLAQLYAIKYPYQTMGLILVGAMPLIPVVKSDPERQCTYISKDEKIRIKEIGQLYRDGKLTLSQTIFNSFLNGGWKKQSFYKPTTEEMARTALYEWINDKNFNSTIVKDMMNYSFKSAFKDCPIPIMLAEGRWDLSFDKDKTTNFHRNIPSARLLIFENSGHNPFSEEPDKFFNETENFIKNLKDTPDELIEKWKSHTRNLSFGNTTSNNS